MKDIGVNRVMVLVVGVVMTLALLRRRIDQTEEMAKRRGES